MKMPPVAPSWRALSGEEQGLLARLLEDEFVGRDALREQLSACRARLLDELGSLGFSTEDDPVGILVMNKVPTEAEAPDEDGVTIHALLHVIRGRATELEFYKEDGSTIRRLPKPEEWIVLRLPAPPKTS